MAAPTNADKRTNLTVIAVRSWHTHWISAPANNLRFAARTHRPMIVANPGNTGPRADHIYPGLADSSRSKIREVFYADRAESPTVSDQCRAHRRRGPWWDWRLGQIACGG